MQKNDKIQLQGPLIGYFDGEPPSLEPQLTKIQLEFCYSIYREKHQEGPFSHILKTYSPIIRTLFKYWPIINDSGPTDMKQTDKFSLESPISSHWICHRVNQVYFLNQDAPIPALLDWLKPYQNRLASLSASIQQKKTIPNLSIIGPLPIGEPGYRGDCIELHLAPITTGSQQNLMTVWYKNIEHVAEAIVQNYPTVAYIKNHSWIVHGLERFFRRLGFHVFDDTTHDLTSNASWGQLLDHDGSLHQQRLNFFQKEHTMPWGIKKAFMPAKAFIQRYSPKSIHGRKVTLWDSEVDFDIYRKFKRKLHIKWERIRQKKGTLDAFIQKFFSRHDPDFLSSEVFFQLKKLLMGNCHLSLIQLIEHVANHRDGAHITRLFEIYVRSRATIRESFNI